MSTITYFLVCLFFVFFPHATAESTKANKQTKLVCRENSRDCDLVNRWFIKGTAAGNAGDFYDNRDRGHSMLRLNSYPQLSAVTYTEKEKAEKFDFGGQKKILPHVTIGNSSTSSNVRTYGSQPRAMYYTWSKGLKFLYTQYRKNNLYVYPEHRDYDEGHNGRPGYGDLYPTNTPYLIISQGSSGSDQVFVRSFVKTLAAFRPDTKEILIKTGLLMPTLQMIFRSANKDIRHLKEYLTGKAHPTVFRGSMINSEKMVQKAHSIRLDNIPPMIQLKVIRENYTLPGVDYFEADVSEKLADTPAVIARVFRGKGYAKRLVVSAEESFDINKRPLTYHWVVLRGDSDKINMDIRDDGAVADIMVSYHPRHPVSSGSDMESNRVDIGVFVRNGTWYSAPGFITVFFLDNEARTYDTNHRLVDICYDAVDTEIGYSTSDPRRFINKGYNIFDWNALFDTILSKRDEFPFILFKEQLSDAYMNVISKAAASFKQTQERDMKLDQQLKTLKSSQKKLRENMVNIQKKLDNAEAAYKLNPTTATKIPVDRAKEEHANALEDRKKLGQEMKHIRIEINNVNTQYKDIFLSKPKDFQWNIKKNVETVLNRLKNETNIYFNHQDTVDALADASSKENKRRFINARKKLENYGLLKKEETKRVKLNLIQQVEASRDSVLTECENNLIQEFNVIMMNEVLFPHFLKRKPTKNFVDFRLTAPKTWRDVYHYDNGGNTTGWTRYDDGSISEYTPGGNLVFEKDKSGRVLKARKVNYILDKKAKRLEVSPRDEVILY